MPPAMYRELPGGVLEIDTGQGWMPLAPGHTPAELESRNIRRVESAAPPSVPQVAPPPTVISGTLPTDIGHPVRPADYVPEAVREQAPAAAATIGAQRSEGIGWKSLAKPFALPTAIGREMGTRAAEYVTGKKAPVQAPATAAAAEAPKAALVGFSPPPQEGRSAAPPAPDPNRVVSGYRGSSGAKGGYVPTSRKTEKQMTVYDPESLAQLEESIQKQGVDRASGLMQMSRAYATYAKQQQAEAESLGQEAKSRRVQVAERLAKLDAERAELASAKIDPGRYWVDRGPVFGLIQALAQAGGEYAHILGRTSGNTAKSIVDRAVDADIDAQKFNIQARERGLQVQMGLLDRFIADGMDPVEAEKAARMMIKESMATALKGTEAQGLATQAVADANREAADLKKDLGKSQVAVSSAETYIAPGTGATGGQLFTVDDYKATGLWDPTANGGRGGPVRQLGPSDMPVVKAARGARAVAWGREAGKGTVGKEVPVIEGYAIPDPKFQRQAVGISQQHAALEETAVRLKTAMRRIQAAKLGSPEFHKARAQLNSAYEGFAEQQAHVDAGVGANGAPFRMTKFMIDRIKTEVGPNPAASMWDAAKAKLNPAAGTMMTQLEVGLDTSVSKSRAVTQRRLEVMSQGRAAPMNPPSESGGAEESAEQQEMKEE